MNAPDRADRARPAPPDRLRRRCKQLERKLLWLSAWMIHNANHIRPNRDGLKVGGHQASCASRHLHHGGAVFRDRCGRRTASR